MEKLGIADNKNILVIYSNTNVKGKHDATGAFRPEAKAFCKVQGIPWKDAVGIKCPRVPKMKRRGAFYEALRSVQSKPLDTIAIFSHGWSSGFQFGFNKTHIPELVKAIVANGCTDTLKIILFACSTAENSVKDSKIEKVSLRTDGGFADMLRDEMARQGITQGRVDAHKTAGHTTINPYVVRFLCSDVFDEERGGEGGAWIVAPRSEYWKKWVAALRNKKGGLRYRFPFLCELGIRSELAGIPFMDFTKE